MYVDTQARGEAASSSGWYLEVVLWLDFEKELWPPKSHPIIHTHIFIVDVYMVYKIPLLGLPLS